MAKETLSVELEAGLIERVRRYSQAHGTGVAETIEQLIGTLPVNGAHGPGNASVAAATRADAADDWIGQLTPGVRKLLGAGAGDADEEDYHRHLLERYGR